MDKYNNNDLIIKEISEKIIIQKKHITIIEQDIIRMNENFNYHLEKYKNTIDEKIKLNNLIIDNFTKDIIYRISIIDNNNNNNKIDNNKIDNNNKNDDKKLLLIKKDYDDKINKCNDYIYDVNYQLIKLKHDITDKINEKINELNNDIDNKINKNNKNTTILICCGLLFLYIFIF